MKNTYVNEVYTCSLIVPPYRTSYWFSLLARSSLPDVARMLSFTGVGHGLRTYVCTQ